MDDLAVMRLLRADIDNVLHTLSPRECGVLRMRYGLDDGQEKTLEEVGARYKVRNLPFFCRSGIERGSRCPEHRVHELNSCCSQDGTLCSCMRNAPTAHCGHAAKPWILVAMPNSCPSADVNPTACR